MPHRKSFHFKKSSTNIQAKGGWIRDDSRRFQEEEVSNFDQMKSLDSRLERLERSAPDSLLGFYEPKLKSFSIRPGTTRFSVTSTLFAIDALLSSQDSGLYSNIANLDMRASVQNDNNILLREVVQETLLSNWDEDDMFQVPLLVHVLLKADKDRFFFASKTMNEEKSDKMRRLIHSLLSARPKRRNGQYQNLSDYLTFLCAQAMATINNSTPDFGTENDQSHTSTGGLPEKALPEGAPSELSLGLSRSSEVAFNELCRQLAFYMAGDRSNFDEIRLAYSLLTYVISTKTMSGFAGIEVIPGDGPLRGSGVGLPNNKLVKEALNIFFMEQNQEGLWSKGQPIYKSFRKTGRDVGNAFVFATDTLGSLLSTLPADYFRPHMDKLEKTLTWIESHQNVEVISNYCDPDSLKCYGKPLKGWSSPHLSQEIGLQAWSTAQTISCISNMRTVVKKLMHEDVLIEFGGIPTDDIPKMTAWNRLLDADLGNPRGPNNYRTLKDVIKERIIEPFSGQSSIAPSYSAILFGPPGTAKTTICEALAERMGWDFLVIDTAAFLADGLTNVAARIRYVFERLTELEKCVILFDEIEEFCLDRETPGLGMENRLLTQQMLTAINDLRRRKQSVFFMATNRLRAFDSAIIRPGRFDMQLFVGTPNLESRCIQLQQKLASLPIEEEEKSVAVKSYRDFLESVWSENAMFMNYLEGMQFASSCANIVATGAQLDHDSMASILKIQAVVMTVRGPVRDEYIASMELTRL